MKYTVNYGGARISSNSMIGIAKIIAGKEGDVREVYRNMIGRYPTEHQMKMVEEVA